MPTPIDLALASEVRAELARSGLTARAIQEQVGISSSTWLNYFKRACRSVPVPVLMAVAECLGVEAWDLLRRAEQRSRESPRPGTQDLLITHRGGTWVEQPVRRQS